MIIYDAIKETITYAHERHKRILTVLRERGRASVSELRALTGASAATIRRDLAFLEASGRVQRAHGGALPAEPSPGEASFDRKSRRELRAKTAIAEAAAGLAGDARSVFVDSGTTTLAVGLALMDRAELTLYTNSVPLLSRGRDGGARLVAIGGEVRAVSQALVGAPSQLWLGRLSFDIAFLGASGIDPARGPLTTELGEARVKEEAARASKRVVLLADASKWALTAPVRFAEWSQIESVITDHRPSGAERRAMAPARIVTV